MGNHIETKCIHGNLDFSWDEPTKAVSFPIYQTATFGHIGLGHSTGFDYTREKNPTRQHLEEILTALEGAYDTTAFSSGMAAVTAVFDLFAPGDHVICSEDLYGGVTRLVNTIGKKNGLMVDFVNTGDLDEIKRVLRPETKALYIETPSNPMMEITDLSACAELAKEHNLLMITDNTFLSPYLQNPIALGADIVIHSASKFLCGHNDTIAGFVCSAKEELAAKIRLIAKTTGGCLSPFDSWLVMRGIKTLAVRMERQQENAGNIARWLTEQKKVRKVYYAGLETHHLSDEADPSGCSEGVERKARHHRHSAAPVRWTGACGRADCRSGAGVCFLRKNPRCRDGIAAEQKKVAFATRCRHKNPAGQDFC